MGFRKTIRSKKGVDVEYWRLVNLTYTEDNLLRMRVAGYIDADTYAAGADPVDVYECTMSNADIVIKSSFYELLERFFPIFEGAEKDFTYSGQNKPGGQILSVMTPRGDLVEQSTIGQEEPEEPENIEPPEEPGNSDVPAEPGGETGPEEPETPEEPEEPQAPAAPPAPPGTEPPDDTSIEIDVSGETAGE